MQKMDFNFNFFLEILQRHGKVAILGTLRKLDHQKSEYQFEAFILFCMQKINTITHVFFQILQRNSKLVILGDLGMYDRTYLKLFVSI